MTANHAAITALIALGIGFAMRLRTYIRNFAWSIPILLFLLGTLDHAIWNGQAQMPEWIQAFHDMLGSGYATKPLLLILLALAIIIDYWVLNKQKEKLPRLVGEPIINPLTEIYKLIHSLFVQRDKFGHLLTFYRERRELGMIHQFGNKETQERKSHLREKIEDHYRPLLAFTAVLFLVTLAVTQTSLLQNNVDICFACLFDGLQSWWSDLEWYEKGAIGLFTFALMFPLLGFWSGVGLATTVTATFASGDRIADIIRHPSQLRSPEFVMSAGVGVGLSRIPGRRQVSKKVFKGAKDTGHDGVRIINKKYAGQTYNLSGDLAKKYPNGVKFTNDGFPDFSPYSKAKVKIDGLKGNTSSDFTAANKALGLKITPSGYTWHHVEDGRTLTLVPTDLHQAVRHTGGAALIRKGLAP